MSRVSLRAPLALAFLATASVGAQQPVRDTVRTRADSVHALEAVAVTAIRAHDQAPIARTTLTITDIEQRYHGQDVPTLLQGTPSLTIKSETGTPWGYSYIRLRGMEYKRVNFTLDGIPLNDPEDHVLYFADFPDLGNSLQSVQVQRGVGTSSTGVAAYAGSVNLETMSLATSRRTLDAQAQAGAFASNRGSLEYASGVLANNVAFYLRGSALSTDGYRRHAGIDGRSFFLSAAWFGTRNMLKLTSTAGVFADTMAYTGATSTEIAQDRRFNPLRPDERDRFGEQVTGLTYVRSLNPASSLSTTIYRISASGDYDVCIDKCDQPVGAADLWRFFLDFGWYGVTSVWTAERDRLRLSVGANANTYARNHYAYDRADPATELYFNTGHKRDASLFAKASYDMGRFTAFGDVQGRAAWFHYDADRNAGIPDQSIDWRFLNPKAGLTYRVSPAISLYGSYGINSREPSRDDMFAGFDNLDTTNVAFVGSLHRLGAERAQDLETGVTLQRGATSAQVNVFDMRLHDEILPIGELSYIGTPLRKNVPSSSRSGVELDVSHRVHRSLDASANVTWMTSDISAYTDAAGNTYRDVPALLTPRVQTSQRLTWHLGRVDLTAEGRYAGRSQLTNTNDPGLVLPATWVMDGRAAMTIGRYTLSVFGDNLGNSRGYSTGNVSSDGTPRYFVLAPPNVHLLVRAIF